MSMDGARLPEDFTPDKDKERTALFAGLMWAKWQQGRDKHGVEVKIDPIEEAQRECIDLANYAMEAYYRLDKLQMQIQEIKNAN
jgi:hypothetical protein